MSSSNTKKTPQEIREQLDQYNGTEQYHRHPLVPAELLLFTDGVVAAASLMESWWLLDIIVSYQFERSLKLSQQRFTVWRLAVTDGVGIVTAHTDWDSKNPNAFPPIVEQVIPYTDFPLPEFFMWQETNILLLPSEH